MTQKREKPGHFMRPLADEILEKTDCYFHGGGRADSLDKIVTSCDAAQRQSDTYKNPAISYSPRNVLYTNWCWGGVQSVRCISCLQLLLVGSEESCL